MPTKYEALFLSLEWGSLSKGSVVVLYAGSLLRNGSNRYDAKLAPSRVR